MPLPTNLIADTLNRKGRRHERGHRGDDSIPMLHVSSLIKSGKQDFFCPREFVLRYMERRHTGGGGIPPKFALLYAVGHFYGQYIVNEFLRRNPEYRQYAWGNWTCLCKYTRRERTCYDHDMECRECATRVDQYEEIDLFNPLRTVIGHADLIFYYEGIYYIYEFKSIERGDVPFGTLNAPLGDHVLQASNYYYMLKGEGKEVSPDIRFVYVDRSMNDLYTSIPFKEFTAKRVKAARLANIYKRAKKCHTSIEKGLLPERKCESITCGRAKQCSVAVSCFSRTSQRVKRVPPTQLA